MQEDLDGLLTVVTLVLGTVEVIRLVDEQHAAHRLLDHFFGLRRGVPDVLADEIVPRHRHQVAFTHVAEPVQNLRHAKRDGGLTRSRVAGEAHVERGRLGGELEVAARPIDEQQGCDIPNSGLDRRESHQLRVELIQHLLNVRRVMCRLERHFFAGHGLDAAARVGRHFIHWPQR